MPCVSTQSFIAVRKFYVIHAFLYCRETIYVFNMNHVYRVAPLLQTKDLIINT